MSMQPDTNTGVSSHSLLQGIFPNQGSNLCLLCLLHWQAGILYHQRHLGSPVRVRIHVQVKATSLGFPGNTEPCGRVVAPYPDLRMDTYQYWESVNGPSWPSWGFWFALSVLFFLVAVF